MNSSLEELFFYKKFMNQKQKSAKLVLENGIVLEGISFGYLGETIGEICFNTGMTGYQEILTDPSYCGQLVTMTQPHIGNYGINEEDIESDKIQVSGFIIKQETILPSNYRSQQSIGDYLRKNKIIGIQGVDTRMLTRIIRTQGAMNAIISTEDINKQSLLRKLKKAPSMSGLDLAKVVTCKKSYTLGDKKSKFQIVAIDYGIKKNILNLLENSGCYVTVIPANTPLEKILKLNPDGIFLSNGPGDPAAVNYGIDTIKSLLGVKPIFGICLGHQILALALGGETYKLKFGHRGCNHPVKNLDNGQIEITSQNHGFSVKSNSLSEDIKITHISLNDETVEGIYSKKYSAFSVQYHPESSPGPHDSRYLFNQFISLMEQFKSAKKT
tara:strand:+ start:251 stop:1402 length:1152 start_codon:yes stop_codon:yes gene_type:complete